MFDIKRRSILKQIFASPLLFTAGAHATTQQKNKKVNRSILLNSFHIAGFQYYYGSEIINTLQIEQCLKLNNEPDNHYDRYAVEIYAGDKKLGYIPKTDNRHISRLIDEGATLDCVVLETEPQSLSWKAVKVGVYLQV